MIKTTKVYALFAVILIIGFAIPAFADYLSPKKQLESGVLPEDIICKENRILVIRGNGNPACVTQSTAERMGWEIIKTVFITNAEPTTPKVTVLDVSSQIEFVDDNREYPRALQKSPAPSPLYDRVMASMTDGVSVDNAGTATITSLPHENYSFNPGVGFYTEDWFPSYVPDGQKLLYTETKCHPSGNCGVGIHFVPTSFVLHENATFHDLIVSKGFSIGISYSVLPLDEVEDSIEYLSEIRESQPRNYGGFVEMTRDGKTVLAYEGGNALNRYYAGLTFHPDEHTSVHVGSNYHTLDELIPIFDSVME